MTKVMNNLLSKYKIGGVVLGLALSIGLTSCDDMFEPAMKTIWVSSICTTILTMLMVCLATPIPVCQTANTGSTMSLQTMQ